MSNKIREDFTKKITVLENIMGDTEVSMNKYSETISTLGKKWQE